MAWLEKRKAKDGTSTFRLRDVIKGKKIPVIKNLGIWRQAAEEWKVTYEKAISQGFTFTPPIKVADIAAFLKARAEGKDNPNHTRRLSIPEMCDLYLEKQGPSFKGGVNLHHHSAYNRVRLRLEWLKQRWAGRYADEISKLDVRDLLASHPNVGYRLRHIGAFGAMYGRFYEWNEEGNILAFQVRLPTHNPFSKYRKELKAAQKKELPDTRVLSQDEWARFSRHLTPRAFAICDLALRRFLRLADIKAISATSVIDGQIRGIQAKTGFEYIVPIAGKNHPKRYDFTNFADDFLRAQKKAGLEYPTDHPLHFSFKDLRRTGATWAYRKTKDLVGISAMLGHQDISTTRRYLNIDKTDREAIARAVDEMANGIQEVI